MLPREPSPVQACPDAPGVPQLLRCECCGRPLYPHEGKVCRPCERYVARLLAQARLAPRPGEGRQARQQETTPC